jgi:predicted phosphodiesterase
VRIALVSDIHGSLVSLQAVLAAIERDQVDQVVCLGDMVTLGPQPHEVVAQLRTLDVPGVVGNHESDLFRLEAIRQDADTPPWVVEDLERCARLLSKADLDYLCSYRPVLEIPLEAGARLLCCHGSPRSNQEFLLATTPAAELDAMLAGCAATVVACGHTHVQMMRRHKRVMILNPGSVGQALEQLPFDGAVPRILPWAEYGLVSCADGALSVELRRVPVDLDAYVNAALHSDMPAKIKDVWACLGEDV